MVHSALWQWILPRFDRSYFDLDDVKYGKHPNPYVLDQVVAGTHKLLVYDDTNTGSVTAVEVFRSRRTEIKVSLLAEGPYVGGAAPRFSARSIDDQTLSLEGMKGKVVGVCSTNRMVIKTVCSRLGSS